MAKNVVINTVTYNNVPYIEIPQSGGGTAEFYDVSDATLNNGNLMVSGITAYGGNGTKYTGTITEQSSSALTVSGDTVTVPAGYYSSSASASVAAGSATAPTSISGTSATVNASSNTLTLTKSVSVTPVVTAGYVSSGTASSSSISLSASVTTKAAATITPTTSNQTIASGTYLTGTQTIAGDADLVASNIRSGVTIFNVTGTMSAANISQDSVTKVLSIS